MGYKLIIFKLLEQINTTFFIFFVHYYEVKQPLMFKKKKKKTHTHTHT